MNQEIETKLPDKLSALVTMAFEDSDKLDRALYEPMSERWHDFNSETNRCEVCLAGMVMAGGLEADRARTISPSLSPLDFNNATSEKLNALELFRGSDFGWALQKMGQISELTVEGLIEARVLAHNKVSRAANYYAKRMLELSSFSNWDQFDDFSYHAKRVVVRLEAMGY